MIPDGRGARVVEKRLCRDEKGAVGGVRGLEVGAAFKKVEGMHVAFVAGLGGEGPFVQVRLRPFMDGIQDVDVQVVEPGVEGFVLQIVVVRDEGGGHVRGGVFGVRFSLQVILDWKNGLRLGQGVDQAGK